MVLHCACFARARELRKFFSQKCLLLSFFYARLSDFPLSWKKVTEWNKPYPPTLYRGTFDIKGEIRDTFLHMKDWTKGVAFINGHNLGRYWELGPQETLYLPSPWLRRGNNEVSLTEQFRLS